MQETQALPPLTPPSPTIPQRIRARWRRDLVFFSIAIVVVIVDQLTKAWVRNNLAYGEVGPEFGPVQIINVANSGAAFGILPGQTSFLIIMSMFGLAAIVLYYVYPPMDHGLIRIALGMQLGGAIGNLICRVRFGQVTDFIDVGDFPTFNVADACITTSIVIVLGFFVMQEFEQQDKHKAEQAAKQETAGNSQQSAATSEKPSSSSDADTKDG